MDSTGFKHNDFSSMFFQRNFLGMQENLANFALFSSSFITCVCVCVCLCVCVCETKSWLAPAFDENFSKMIKNNKKLFAILYL